MGVRAGLGPSPPAVPGEMARCGLTVENTGDRAEDVRLALGGRAGQVGMGHPVNEALTQQILRSSAWGVDDLIGLRQLGRQGGCVTVPPVPFQGAPR